MVTGKNRGKDTYEEIFSGVLAQQINEELEGKVEKDSVSYSDGFKVYTKFLIV